MEPMIKAKLVKTQQAMTAGMAGMAGSAICMM